MRSITSFLTEKTDSGEGGSVFVDRKLAGTGPGVRPSFHGTGTGRALRREEEGARVLSLGELTLGREAQMKSRGHPCSLPISQLKGVIRQRVEKGAPNECASRARKHPVCLGRNIVYFCVLLTTHPGVWPLP